MIYTHTIKVKPLSVNLAWQGQRFKTPAYKQYERALLFLLPTVKLPIADRYDVLYEFGFSNIASDLDNPAKLITDILQKKYMFNDKKIFKMTITKNIVSKGREYIGITIRPFDNSVSQTELL